MPVAQSAHFCVECGARLMRADEACWLCHHPAAAGLRSSPISAAPGKHQPTLPPVEPPVSPTSPHLRGLRVRRAVALVALVLVGVIGLPIAGFIALFAVCVAAISAGGPASWTLASSDWIFVCWACSLALVAPSWLCSCSCIASRSTTGRSAKSSGKLVPGRRRPRVTIPRSLSLRPDIRSKLTAWTVTS